MFRRQFYVASVVVLAAVAAIAFVWPPVLWSLLVLGPLILLGLWDSLQRKHAVLRNWPIIGHFRYLLESIGPEIQQYFIEKSTDEQPFSRERRSVVYQRAKGELDTLPFGTLRDVYEVGYEWMAHSLLPKPRLAEEPRVRIGGPDCSRPYEASHLNVSAMSFGSLSSHATLALNEGAKRGGFFHNTGEGGISPYHSRPGGDLVWQIGTGYFGCRTAEGRFDAGMYRERVSLPQVKMVELKLSQGAKPGHGGILPGAKVTPEIAAIRGVPVGRDVISPPHHLEFDTPDGLLRFVASLRDMADGKPVGIKLCVGSQQELEALTRAMRETGILPDFITIDGGEGGTGAAPLEFSNSVGWPLREGLLLVHNALVGLGLRDRVKLIVAGKIVTGFQMVRALALGADVCSSARGMMFAVGCIQARRCNTNHCPVGVATQDPALVHGLDVRDKADRVARYHEETIESFLDLIGAAGLSHPHEIRPHHIWRRVTESETQHFGQIYGFLQEGQLVRR